MKLVRVAAPVWLLLFVFAFVAAPASCEWGLSAYTWSGIACLVGLGAMPFVVRTELTDWRRILTAAGIVVATALVWLGGLFAANVRIMCRLF
ncbi:MAG TPA: hypothetical protein VL295_04660 [Gemmatimonadales bacterium]|jgi:hypothetical protein|nr:hypothetical protein [Gemmatimonadales bacterium]